LESAQYCAKFARGGQNDGFNGDKESANAATLKLDYSDCSSFFRSGKAVANMTRLPFSLIWREQNI